MKENEITIVTAFFDIGRDKFKGRARGNDKYLDYFKFWARIKNRLIVYTNKEVANEVRKIRQSFNLLDKTEIVVIDDIKKIEPSILEKMEQVSHNEDFLKFRYMENSADSNAYYDYLVFLKAYFLYDATLNHHAIGLLAWIDFGFNHGGDVFTNPEEFSFLWKTDLPADKITMFSINEDINKPVFQIVQSYDTYMMGAPFIVPSSLTENLWNSFKKSVISLTDCGFIDDDQILLLMMARNNPKITNVIKSDWFRPLKDYGNKALTAKSLNKNTTLKYRLLYKYRVHKRNYRCGKNLKKLFYKNYLD